MLRPLMLTATCLLLAPLAAPTATWAAGNFDGIYRGDQTLIRNDNAPECAKAAQPVVVHVVDNSFARAWGGGRFRVNITLHIAPDGSFAGQASPTNVSGRFSGPVDVHGRITGDTLEAELGSRTCAVKMTLRKS